eukprot:3928061-Pyramimonas_sp.AAC.1
MRGDSIDDLETFDCFVVRTLAQHGGRAPMGAVRSHRKIVVGYANHELQTVNDERSKGLLKQLMDNPSMLATFADQSAIEATARCSAELQHLREAQMLAD